MLARPSRSQGTDPVQLALRSCDKCCQTLEGFAQVKPTICLIEIDLCGRRVSLLGGFGLAAWQQFRHGQIDSRPTEPTTPSKNDTDSLGV
jgi:hypothetical protein